VATAAQIKLMKTRRDAAKSALRFFKDIKGVRSTNNPFDFTTVEENRAFTNYRRNNPNTITQRVEDAMRTGIGNCDQKARICLTSLMSNPLLVGNSTITLSESDNYDHVFVVVTDEPFEGLVNLRNLGKTAMIVDGWTEDWYFPNLSLGTALVNRLTYVPNPRQIYVRIQLAAHLLQPYVSDVPIPIFNDGQLITNNYGLED
jgi:hypothetical protein